MNVQPSPLAVERLCFRYRTAAVRSLTDISFAVTPGELMLVAGGSGSGKSTLLRCLNGLIPRSYTGDLSGAIAINGYDTVGLGLARLAQLVGTLLQDCDRQIAASYMALLGIILLMTLHPATYGVAFRRLGLPDNVAFAIDLAVRFVPSLAGDFSTTLDAQRARGYELERAGGIFKAIRNMAPLVVPITISVILKGEDVIDAMNLHAFGTGRRTWVQELRYQPRDYVVIGFSLGLLAIGIALRVLGLAGLCVPSWLLALAH
jgi:ABC-type dipeptide/oligopeptide/nickel transport system ATPase component